MNRTVLLSLLILALLLVGASCGGTGTVQLDGAKDVQGITEGGFNLVRYDDAGTATNALNPTLDLNVQPGGDTTTVTIAIDDVQPTQGVALDLHYDTSKFTPVDVEFSGLIETDLELAVTRVGGLVAIGQVDTTGTSLRSGEFATVTFRNEPNRSVSAALDAHDKLINVTYSANGWPVSGPAEGFSFTVTSGQVDYNILGIFTSLSGDGSQDGASNIGDLTPLGAMLGRQVTTSDATSARVDYDGNGLPNISDLTPLGANLGEITTGIEILAGDSAASLTVVDTLAWGDSNPPAGPASTETDPNNCWANWVGAIDATSTDLIDANNDNHIFISARAITTAGGANGTEFPALDVDLGPGPNPAFTVESVTIQVNGITVTDGMTLDTLAANDDVTITVTGFDGKFNGADFDPGALGAGTTPTQADYDAELANVQADFAANLISATQELNPNGFAGFETDKTALFLNLLGGGSTVTGQVFPDDDPGNSAEGRVTFAFTNINNAAGDVTVTFDIQPDADAPLIDDIRGDSGQDGDGDWIVTNTTPDVRGHLTFPAGDPAPLDGTTVDVELVDLTNNTQVAVNFNFVAGPPVNGGDYTFTAALGGWDFTVRLPAGILSDANRYMLRFFDLSKTEQPNGGSVNKPGTFLTGGPVAAGFTSGVLPSGTVTFGANNKLAIIPDDPKIRRNPQVTTVGDVVTPVYSGYTDQLKISGDEFSIASITGTPYPQVVFKPGNDPSVILPTETTGSGESVEERNPHRIVIDIAGLADPGGTAVEYAYKVFGTPAIPGQLNTRPVITEGTFTLNPAGGPGPSPIVGVDFGVNIFDDLVGGEGSRDLGNPDFTNKIIRTTSLPLLFGDAGTDVDVLFVQFNGGTINPDSTNQFGFANSNNVILHNDLGGISLSKPLDVRVAGIGANDLDYIGLGHYTQFDVGPGGLVGSLDYEVQLDDPSIGGPGTFEFTFGPGNMLHAN